MHTTRRTAAQPTAHIAHWSKKLRSKNFRMDSGGIEQGCRRFQPVGVTLTQIRAVKAWLPKVHWLLRASALMCCHEMPGCTMHCNSGERYGIFRHIFTPPFLWYQYSPSVGLQRGHRWGHQELPKATEFVELMDRRNLSPIS